MESGRSDGCAASARAIAGLLGWSPSSTRIDVPHLPESLSLESIGLDLSRVGESPKATILKIFFVMPGGVERASARWPFSRCRASAGQYPRHRAIKFRPQRPA